MGRSHQRWAAAIQFRPEELGSCLVPLGSGPAGNLPKSQTPNRKGLPRVLGSGLVPLGSRRRVDAGCVSLLGLLSAPITKCKKKHDQKCRCRGMPDQLTKCKKKQKQAKKGKSCFFAQPTRRIIHRLISRWTIPSCRLVQTRRPLSHTSRAVVQKGYGARAPNFRLDALDDKAFSSALLRGSTEPPL